MTRTLVGKMDGGDIVLLGESESIGGEPLSGDVVEINGRVWAYGENGRRDVTSKYLELTGQVIKQYTLEDYL